jgi:hypothetical protein
MRRAIALACAIAATIPLQGCGACLLVAQLMLDIFGDHNVRDVTFR